MSREIHVLMVMTNLAYNDGVSTFAMNYYTHMNHDEIHMDFVVHDTPEEKYVNLIKANGDSVYTFPSLSLKNMVKLKRKAVSLMKEKHYDIVHCNLPNVAFLYLGAAKKAKVPVRIQHCHETKFSDIKSHVKRNALLWKLGKRYVNTPVACSDLAGKFLFPKEDFIEINNGIDPSKYEFNHQLRESLRADLGIDEDTILLGMVGRYCPTKNQLFALSLMKKLPSNYKLVIFGSKDKEYFESCKQEASGMTNVILHDSVSNINEYYSAFDCLLLPSEHEGLPLTLVEAQANGLLCFASDTITREANIGGVVFLSIDDTSSWVEKITSTSLKRQQFVCDKKKKKKQADVLRKLYHTLLKVKQSYQR